VIVNWGFVSVLAGVGSTTAIGFSDLEAEIVATGLCVCVGAQLIISDAKSDAVMNNVGRSS
jgi:hypothetical protein